MSHLLIETNRLLYPLTGKFSVSLPSIDIGKIVTSFSTGTKRVLAGSLVYDFWIVFKNI